MRFRRYDSIKVFKSAVLDILLENEVQNNLLLSLIINSSDHFTPDWLLAAVSGDGGGTLVALCVENFPLLLYESGNAEDIGSAELLARELRHTGHSLRGVMAQCGLAKRFADAFSGDGAYELHMTTIAMRLDNLSGYEKAPGFCRKLESRDMFFAPYWERAFSEDCRTPAFSIDQNVDRLKTRLKKDTHFIWEDGVPVSQAVHGRNTPNGAVINGVYTPPHFRGRGYATSVVAELSKTLLDKGKSFCCLFGDAANPVSCGIYRKLGYYDVCTLEELRFDT